MKTKIIATYGPALNKPSVLSRAIKHVDIFRLNLSHGSERSWLEYIENIRKAAKSAHKEVALLADLPGPKIRLGDIKSGSMELHRGDHLKLAYGTYTGNAVPLEYDIHSYVKKGSVLSIGDGSIDLAVERVSGKSIFCRALGSGALLSRKGINIRKGNVTAVPPTAEDVKLARFAKRNDFDFIALSFVRSADNVRLMRRKAPGAFIISKIERAEAVREIDEISRESDAIMVARGDLAFDVKIEMVPIMQSRIIRSARRFSKPVIVATQMLASMVENPMPTRAEVNDIATAVTSGADCLMLSEETAIGRYPVDALRTLSVTARNAETVTLAQPSFKITGISDSIAFAAAEIADNYRTDCIFAPTQTGNTAVKLSALRPRSEIIALSRSEKVRRMLNIYHGIHSEKINRYDTVDMMLREMKVLAARKGIRRYIVVSGSPNQAGGTNTLKYIE
ncbi:MAG: pyruvate kinase [Candidatus Marsarchaeota archaeon]|nr:pyruvate kinase [Candidatus Marsarchaeota archaeon]MCL5413023.1 pyruvate kinase [Candidatus Marsarchaeota archaeon]